MKISIAFLLFFSMTFSHRLLAQTKSEPARVKDVIVVFKTHFDIGYTDWAANVSHNYAGSMVEGALNIIDQSKQMPADQQFKWIVAGWPMNEMLAHSKSEVKAEIQKAIRNGNFMVHALPFTFETEACDLESIVQSLGYSSKINREAGLPLPIDAKQTDVPSHSWILPTVLSNAGVKFLHIGCNPASRSPEVPLLFWWEGPDQSRLMTMYFGPYYGTSPAPPDNWPYKTWLAIIHTNDNTGAPTFDEFKKAIHDIEEKNPGAKVRTGSMADFYKAIEAENPQLPVIRGDMPDTWIHGYMSMPREVKLARKLGVDIFNLQKLNTLVGFWGGKSDPTVLANASEALEGIHLFNEHTFGLAMSHGHAGYWAYDYNFESLRAQGFYEPIEFSWQEKSQRVIGADQRFAPVVSQKLKELAASVQLSGERIVVFNPLPRERSGLVTLQTTSNLKNALKDVATGRIIRFSKDHNIYRFNVSQVPPMGYTTLVPVDETGAQPITSLKLDRQKATLENEYFRMTLDTLDGTVKSLIDKKSGKEVVSTNSEWKFGQYVTERFSKTMTDQYAKDYIKAGWEWAYAELGRINLTDKPYQRISGKHPEIEFVKDEISVSARVHFSPEVPHGHTYSVIFTLYQDKPCLETIWSINGKPADAWPEGGWISFPLNIEKPQFKLGRPGAIVDPATDFVKGSNLDYGFLNTGMAVIDPKGQGIGITSPDVPAVSLDRPGLWKYSTSFIPQKPNVFFNLYNNQWSTNFTEWIEGSWSARFYVWSIGRFENEASVITPSEEIRNPLMVGLAHGNAGNLAVSSQGISLSGKGVQVSYFGENKDGEGTILRLWEQTGSSRSIEVKLPQGSKFATAQPVNLRCEKIGEPIRIRDGKWLFNLPAYAPASFILSTDSKDKKSAITPSGGRFIKSLKKGEKITIVTMGTSLTGGSWRCPDVMLDNWLNKEFPGQVVCFNEGVGASASSVGPGNDPALSGIGKLPAVIAHKPDVVFIEFATNDAYLPYKISPDESKKNLNFIIDKIWEANPKTEIILQTMNSVMDKLGSGLHASDRPDLDLYFQGYRDVAKARSLLLVDHYPNWLKLMKEDTSRFDKLVPDRIHPQLPGYQEILLPELKKALANEPTNL